jgi:hypothetical protein
LPQEEQAIMRGEYRRRAKCTDEAESLDAHEIRVSHHAARSLALDFPNDNLTDRPAG